MFSLNMPAQTAPHGVGDKHDVGDKQYVSVTLNNGVSEVFEYRSFMEQNFVLHPPTWVPRAAQGNETELFGLQRVIFIEKDSCEEQSIGLNNLREMELVGMETDPCSGGEKWLFKIKLLTLEKYVGYFQAPGANESGEAAATATQPDRALQGQLLDKTDSKTLNFEEIKRVSFFAR